MFSTSQTYLFNRFFAIVLSFDAAKIQKRCELLRHRFEKKQLILKSSFVFQFNIYHWLLQQGSLFPLRTNSAKGGSLIPPACRECHNCGSLIPPMRVDATIGVGAVSCPDLRSQLLSFNPLLRPAFGLRIRNLTPSSVLPSLHNPAL